MIFENKINIFVIDNLEELLVKYFLNDRFGFVYIFIKVFLYLGMKEEEIV